MSFAAELVAKLDSGSFDAKLKKIYGADVELISSQGKRYCDAISKIRMRTA